MLPQVVPPHEQKTMVRSGLHPFFTLNIKAWINAVMTAVLLAHSCPLYPYPAWWLLPTITYRSGNRMKQELLKQNVNFNNKFNDIYISLLYK